MPEKDSLIPALVTIRTDRFQDLIQSETELNLIRHAYYDMESYKMDHVLDAIFNHAFKYKEGGGDAE